jgi:hypothetical protein
MFGERDFFWMEDWAGDCVAGLRDRRPGGEYDKTFAPREEDNLGRSIHCVFRSIMRPDLMDLDLDSGQFGERNSKGWRQDRNVTIRVCDEIMHCDKSFRLTLQMRNFGIVLSPLPTTRIEAQSAVTLYTH